MIRWLIGGMFLLAVWPEPAAAQGSPPRFGISDNSFLVEEAFNQEAGIFQNIFALTRTRDRHWQGSVTQEWPIGGVRHQLSFTLPFEVIGGDAGVADVMLNYRLQVWEEGDRLPAFSPRVSAVFPSSANRRSLGLRGTGWQVNLPFSRRVGSVYFHANVGATWIREPEGQAVGSGDEWTDTPHVAASAIWAARPMFHLMLEAFAQSARAPGSARENSVTVVPGFRTGWDIGDVQLVAGVGAPVTRGDVRDHGLLLYLSVELPFAKKR